MYRYGMALVAAVSCMALCIACTDDSDDDAPFVPHAANFQEPAVTGNTFYVDPVNGSPGGDGSRARPWRTIEEVFDSGLVESYEFTSHPSSTASATALSDPIRRRPPSGTWQHTSPGIPPSRCLICRDEALSARC